MIDWYPSAAHPMHRFKILMSHISNVNDGTCTLHFAFLSDWNLFNPFVLLWLGIDPVQNEFILGSPNCQIDSVVVMLYCETFNWKDWLLTAYHYINSNEQWEYINSTIHITNQNLDWYKHTEQIKNRKSASINYNHSDFQNGLLLRRCTFNLGWKYQ